MDINFNVTVKLPGWDIIPRLKELREILMETREQLDAKLTELQDTVTAERQEVSAKMNEATAAIDNLTQKVADLEAQIGQPLDLTAEVERVQAVIDSVKDIVVTEPVPEPEPEPSV